jgi:hypothetical protein
MDKKAGGRGEEGVKEVRASGIEEWWSAGSVGN